MSLTIIPVVTEAELSTFVDLPWAIHAQHPLWTPSIKKQDKELLSPHAHAFWQTARRELFLALRDGRPVGRVAAIIDEKYNDFAGQTCGAFGFFECEHDPEAAAALMQAAEKYLAAEGATFMRGPLNPSTNYTCGILVDGFELAPALLMPWNPPYYPEMLEQIYFRKEQDLFAYLMERERLSLPEHLTREVARLKNEDRFTCRVSSRATLSSDIRIMLELYRDSWAENWGFSSLSEKEAEQRVHELKDILDPNFFVLFFHNGQPAAGMVALPDLTPLLRRLNGKLGLMAPWHLWRSRSEMRGAYRLILFGIRKEFRLFGLPLLLLDYMLDQARKNIDFTQIEGSWVLEDNVAINDLIEDFSGRITKRYRIYRREILP